MHDKRAHMPYVSTACKVERPTVFVGRTINFFGCAQTAAMGRDLPVMLKT